MFGCVEVTANRRASHALTYLIAAFCNAVVLCAFDLPFDYSGARTLIRPAGTFSRREKEVVDRLASKQLLVTGFRHVVTRLIAAL